MLEHLVELLRTLAHARSLEAWRIAWLNLCASDRARLIRTWSALVRFGGASALALVGASAAQSALAPFSPYIEVIGDIVAGGSRFQIMVIKQASYWVQASSNEFEDSRGNIRSIDGDQVVIEITRLAPEATDLIGIGAASCVGDPLEEADRAAERAFRLATLLQRVRSSINAHRAPGVRKAEVVYTVNLGKNTNCRYVQAGSGREREQRRVIVVAVYDKGPRADVQGGLRSALERTEVKLFQWAHLEDYSNWPQDQFEVVPDTVTIK